MHDLLHQFSFRAPDSATQHVTSEDTEPDFDLVQPGSVSRGEMKCEPAPLRCPLLHLLMFVGTVIVYNHVELLVRKFAVKMLEKTQKLLVGVAFNTPSLNAAFMDQESR